jgi:integrase
VDHIGGPQTRKRFRGWAAKDVVHADVGQSPWLGTKGLLLGVCMGQAMSRPAKDPRGGDPGTNRLRPMAEMQRSPNEPGGETIRVVHAVLRRALKQAVRWRLVSYNVCVDVDRPRVAKADITPLDGKQVTKLLAVAANDRLCAIFTVAIATGMRLGELFGLHWADVDLEASAIMVKHTLTELSGQLFLTEPKTARWRRRINLRANRHFGGRLPRATKLNTRRAWA